MWWGLKCPQQVELLFHILKRCLLITTYQWKFVEKMLPYFYLSFEKKLTRLFFFFFWWDPKPWIQLVIKDSQEDIHWGPRSSSPFSNECSKYWVRQHVSTEQEPCDKVDQMLIPSLLPDHSPSQLYNCGVWIVLLWPNTSFLDGPTNIQKMIVVAITYFWSNHKA